MADPVDPRVAAFGNIYKTLGPEFKTDWDAVRAKNAELKAYLGTTDYSAQNQEANDFAKLQFALSLMGRAATAFGAAPQPGESPAGTVGRTLVAPIAGDISTIAGPLMKQRAATRLAEQQEERQRKLAAYTATTASAKDRRALAYKLMPTAPKDKAPFEAIKYIVQRTVGVDGGLDTFKFTGPGGVPIQVRQEQGEKGKLGPPLNLVSGNPVTLTQGQELVTFANLPDSLKGAAESPDSKKVANITGHVQEWVMKDGKLVLDPTRQYVIRKTGADGTRLFLPGGDSPDTAITIGSGAGQYKITDTEGAVSTEADRSRVDRKNLLFSFMNQYQDLQLTGTNSAYSARSALFFSQGAYLAGKSPWRFIPPGTAPDDRTKDVIITNPDVLKLIKTKVDSVAQQFLRREFGDASQGTKSSMIAKAVKSILSLPPETVFGAAPIEVMGTREGQTVGYSPTAAAFSPAVMAENIRAVKTALKEGAGADAALLYGPVAYPYNKEDLNKPWGREKVAATAFPGAFGNVGAPGTDNYDFRQAQQRSDVESVLSNVRLRADATQDEHKAVIQDAVIKKVAARDKLQNSGDARLAREGFGYAMEFRRALLDFKNAAAHSNVEGFFTGTAAGIAARLGFAEWLNEEGAPHWRRLQIASARFQEGISRRVGKDFGDDRISNLDAKAYQKLVVDIKSSKKYNRILVEDGLLRVGRDLTDLMAYGGKVGWTARVLERAAEAGVDFSALNTQMDWHGHGYYGENRYSSTRQRTPSLTNAQRSSIRTKGQLKDTLYGGKYTVPSVDYMTDNIPTFTQGIAASKGTPAVKPTVIDMMDPDEFRRWLEERAGKAGLSGQAGIAEMRRRVVRGILRYNNWRNNLR